MYLPQNVFTVSLFALSKATHAIVYISLYIYVVAILYKTAYTCININNSRETVSEKQLSTCVKIV